MFEGTSFHVYATYFENFALFVFPSIGEGTNSRADYELLKKRSVLMQRYIDSDPNLELQALYAVQQLNFTLENPPGESIA